MIVSARDESDRVTKTIDYLAVNQHLVKFAGGRSWKLIEKLVTNIAEIILVKYKPHAVTVVVKKFPIPQASYVSATVTRVRPG